MTPIPVKVTDVNIYPYLGGPSIGPVVPPVIEGASGTYSVGTLMTSIFYNLDIEGGKVLGKLTAHGQYVATFKTENGQSTTSVWMYCLNAGTTPSFGRTITMGKGAEAEELSSSVPPYISIMALTNVNVSQIFPPPAIGQISLITNATGEYIGTQTGTPHLMGFKVEGGQRSSRLYKGQKLIIVSGTNKDGKNISLTNLTCVDAQDPSFFFQTFP